MKNPNKKFNGLIFFGVRFTNVNIPHGVKIKEAYVELFSIGTPGHDHPNPSGHGHHRQQPHQQSAAGEGWVEQDAVPVSGCEIVDDLGVRLSGRDLFLHDLHHGPSSLGRGVPDGLSLTHRALDSGAERINPILGGTIAHDQSDDHHRSQHHGENPADHGTSFAIHRGTLGLFLRSFQPAF